MDILKFSYNWNNKLDCKGFTTLRLSNRFKPDQEYRIMLKGVRVCDARVVDVKRFLLHEINDWIAYIDTGYDANECKEIIKKMYKKYDINWRTKKLCWILFERNKDV